jgi:hypothetical protein
VGCYRRIAYKLDSLAHDLRHWRSGLHPLWVKTHDLHVREHVIPVPGLDSCFVALPKSHIEQVGVVFHKTFIC